MQTIRTRWLAPTNHKGSRVKALSSSGHSTITLAWDDALNVYANHARAAKALADKMAWDGEWVSGDWDGLGGYVFVNIHNQYNAGFRTGSCA